MLAILLAFAALTPLQFVEHKIADQLRGGYQVTAVDMNADGKLDLLVIASGMTEVFWYENPGWTRHVIAGGFKGLINAAAQDIDGDGIPEVAIASGFASPGPNQTQRSPGIVTLLKHTAADTWEAREIDRLTTSHRLRWMKVAGQWALLNVPLAGAGSEPPDYAAKTPLVYYRAPDWKRELISDALTGIVHGVLIEGDGRFLTASFAGIDEWKYDKDAWTRTHRANGDATACPKCGSSDVATGRLGREPLLAAIEPWHGNQVAVYGKSREVIDDSLVDGHTILTADFDGDGNDEIVAGFRGGAKSVYLWRAAKGAGAKFERQVIDQGGMGADSCAAADLNGDKRIDLICIASATATLKWYENVTGRR